MTRDEQTSGSGGNFDGVSDYRAGFGRVEYDLGHKAVQEHVEIRLGRVSVGVKVSGG